MNAILFTPTSAQSEVDTGLDIVQVAGNIGAEVRGLRLSAALTAVQASAIKTALLKYKVLFFRGQQHLDDAGQQAFARLWGPLVAHPTVPSKEGT